MSPIPTRRLVRSQIIITVLVMTLLFAQMLGLVHATAHANWQGTTVHSVIDEALFDDVRRTPADDAGVSAHTTTHANTHAHGQHHHSCEAYDGATLAPMMYFDFPSLPLLPPIRLLVLWQAFASWDAPVVCGFRSRAPPG